jgi:hypothetical protein
MARPQYGFSSFPSSFSSPSSAGPGNTKKIPTGQKKKGAAQPVYYRSPSPRFLLAHGILFFFFLFLTMYVSSGPIASQSVLAYTVSLSFFIGGTIAKIYGEAPVSLLVFPFIRYLFPSRCSSAIRDKENSQTS